MEERNIEPEWVNYTDAERYSGLSHTTLWRYVSCGEHKAARVGRSVRLLLGANKAADRYRRASKPLEPGMQPSGLRRSCEGIKASSYAHHYRR